MISDERNNREGHSVQLRRKSPSIGPRVNVRSFVDHDM